jgi:hypothetical protein
MRSLVRFFISYVRSSDSLLHAGELLFTLFKDSVLKRYSLPSSSIVK